MKRRSALIELTDVLGPGPFAGLCLHLKEVVCVGL